MSSTDDHLRQALARAFADDRAHLFGLCYRLTGSVADADELVQEAFERTLRAPPEDLDRPLRPFLAKVATRLALDRLRHRRSLAYVGPWLPAPLETEMLRADDAHIGEARYGVLESLTLAFLVALEALSPKQRAVIVFRDVFDMHVDETAEALGIGESDVKVSLHRARARLEGYEAARDARPAELGEATRVALGRFVEAAAASDWDSVARLLREDVRLVQDGGGETHTARKPVVGRARVVTFHRRVGREGEHGFRPLVLNGLPALLISLPERAQARFPSRLTLSIALGPDGRIAQILNVIVDHKLAHLDFPGRG